MKISKKITESDIVEYMMILDKLIGVEVQYEAKYLEYKQKCIIEGNGWVTDENKTPEYHAIKSSLDKYHAQGKALGEALARYKDIKDAIHKQARALYVRGKGEHTTLHHRDMYICELIRSAIEQ